MLEAVLTEMGLTKGEAKIYLALLKTGKSSVNQLSERIELHRPNIYDYLQKLIDKGLVNYSTEENVKRFSAVDPEKLLEFIQAKEDALRDNLSEFKKIQNTPDEEITVEVYKGREGVKTSFNDLIRVGEDYVGFGIDEATWEKDFATVIRQHFRKEKKTGIKSRILTSKKATAIYEHGNYRYIDEKYFSPTSTLIYGDRVCTIIREPLTTIIVTNKQNAETQRRHFEMLWDIADTKTKGKIKILK